MSQECPQLLIAQGKVASADDVVIDIDQVDAGAEKAEPRLLFHPGVLDPQAIRKEDVSPVQARKQWRARDTGGEIHAPRGAQNVHAVEPDPFVLRGPLGDDAIGAVAAIVVDEDDLEVLESLVGEAAQCRLRKRPAWFTAIRTEIAGATIVNGSLSARDVAQSNSIGIRVSPVDWTCVVTPAPARGRR